LAGNGTIERLKRRDPAVASESRAREPRFSRRQPDVRRLQIVDAAVRCLAKGGVGAFTVSAICAEAGISHGLINHYFASKEDLLVAVYEKVTDGLADFTRDILAGRHDPEDKLCAIVDASFSGEIFHESNLAVWLALWSQVRNNPALRAAHKELYDGYRHAIEHQVHAVAQKRRLTLNPARLALSLTALIDGLWLEWCLDPSVFAAAEAKAACYDLLQARLGAL
jgi:TetR/AcrR family transcriptional regulator, transcriptional repressor of bet genes